MKLNKIIIISLSLVLAPALNAQTVTAVDTAKGLARTVAFHGSRFVAGNLIAKGINFFVGYVYQKNNDNRLAWHPNVRAGFAATTSGLASAVDIATILVGAQQLNSLTKKSKLFDTLGLAHKAGQADTAGRLAFWAGLASVPMMRHARGEKGSLPFFLDKLC